MPGRGVHCQQIAANESVGYLNFIDQLILLLVQGLLYWICCFSIDPTRLSKADFLSPNVLMPHLAHVICFCGSQRAPRLLGGDLLSVNCNRLSLYSLWCEGFCEIPSDCCWPICLTYFCRTVIPQNLYAHIYSYAIYGEKLSMVNFVYFAFFLNGRCTLVSQFNVV